MCGMMSPSISSWRLPHSLTLASTVGWTVSRANNDNACCAGAQTVLKYGLPQRSMAALQAYAASAMPSTDFQYALMALMLLASRPMALVHAPLRRFAVCVLCSFTADPRTLAYLFALPAKSLPALLV